jgi:hypothetical protein
VIERSIPSDQFIVQALDAGGAEVEECVIADLALDELGFADLPSANDALQP